MIFGQMLAPPYLWQSNTPDSKTGFLPDSPQITEARCWAPSLDREPEAPSALEILQPPFSNSAIFSEL